MVEQILNNEDFEKRGFIIDEHKYEAIDVWRGEPLLKPNGIRYVNKDMLSESLFLFYLPKENLLSLFTINTENNGQSCQSMIFTRLKIKDVSDIDFLLDRSVN